MTMLTRTLGALVLILYELIAWHEDVFVHGPPLDELQAYLKGTTVAHFEMMQALPGKRDELIAERQMESVFNTLRGRPAMLTFTPGTYMRSLISTHDDTLGTILTLTP